VQVFEGWVTSHLTERFYAKLEPLLVTPVPAGVPVGLPRYSLEQGERTKGGTRYVAEVVATYPDLAPFAGITEADIRREGVDIWVSDLAPTPRCVREDEHVGYVLRRGDAFLAMVDSSGVHLFLELPGLGRANGATQLMIQTLEAVRNRQTPGPGPQMLMPAASDREGRQAAQIRSLQKYVQETGIAWWQGGSQVDLRDLGTRLRKNVEGDLAQHSADERKLGAIRAAVLKLEHGENGQLAEAKLPFPLQYRRDGRGRKVKGPHNGTLVDPTDDPARIEAVRCLVRGLNERRSWTDIGRQLADINPRLPMPDADGRPCYFADATDWAAAAKQLVTTKARGRPRTPEYLYATVELWRTGRFKTIRRVGDALQGWQEIEVAASHQHTYPMVTPPAGERYIEITAVWDRWPTDPQTGQSLVRYGLNDQQLRDAYDELVRRHRQGSGHRRAGPRARQSTMKLIGVIPPRPVDDVTELRTYAQGSGRHAALVISRGEPGGNRATATRVGKVPLSRLVRALGIAAENAVADVLDLARPFSPPADDRSRALARAERDRDRLEADIGAETRAGEQAARDKSKATSDRERALHASAVRRASERLEELAAALDTLDRRIDDLRAETAPATVEYLHLADIIAVGQKAADGHAPTPLAQLWLSLFDWTTWTWTGLDPYGTTSGLVRATVDMLVPLTDGTVCRLPLELTVRAATSNRIDPADRVRAILLDGLTLEQLATIEQIGRPSLVAATSRWLTRRGCRIPLAALSNPHPDERHAVWALATGQPCELDERLLDHVHQRYFTDRPFTDRTWTNTPATGTSVAEPDDHHLAQTAINSLLRLKDPTVGADQDDLIAALGCTRVQFTRQLLGWSAGRARLGRPAYVTRHPDGRITPIPCTNPSCTGRRPFASTARLTPLTWPYGVVCPDCGHVPDPHHQHPALPDSYRQPTSDDVVPLTTAVRTRTVPQLAAELDTSEFVIAAILEERRLPYQWDGHVRRVPVTVLPALEAALTLRASRPRAPEGTLTVPDVAARLHLNDEQVRHLTRTGRIERLPTTTETGGWLYQTTHIDGLAATGALNGYRPDTLTRPQFADLLGTNQRTLRQLEATDADFPRGWDLPRGHRRWLQADAHTYLAARRTHKTPA
jgi:hypothetical protein